MSSKKKPSLADKHLAQTRLLINLAGYLKNYEGVKLAKLAEDFSTSEDEMRRLLTEELMITGIPPYTPSDYVCVFFRGEPGNPTVHLHQHEELRQAVRLTTSEALALRTMLEGFRGATSKQDAVALDRLVERISAALPNEGEAQVVRATQGLSAKQESEPMRVMLAQLDAAAQAHQVVEIDYYQLHEDTSSLRVIHPWEIFEHGSRFYLHGYCEDRADQRHFRVDRIRSVKALEREFPPPTKRTRKRVPAPAMPKGKDAAKLVVRFDPEIAEDVVAEWCNPPAKAELLKDGSARVELPLLSESWAISWVLAFGPRAELLEPKGLRQALKQRVEKMLG